MGGLTPIVPMMVASTAGAALDYTQDRSERKAADAAARREADYRNAVARNRVAQLDARQVQDDRAAQARLKRALALQRARFGAAGIGSDGGSAAAVLAGLRRQAESDSEASRAVADLRIQAIEQQRDWETSRDLLAAADAGRRSQMDAYRQALGPLVNLLESDGGSSIAFELKPARQYLF